VVILDRDRRSLGLLVGQVFGVGPLASVQEDPPGALVRGVGQVEGGAITLLDPDTVAERSAQQFGQG
jgi:chemotaxis signal transduction protein